MQQTDLNLKVTTEDSIKIVKEKRRVIAFLIPIICLIISCQIAIWDLIKPSHTGLSYNQFYQLSIVLDEKLNLLDNQIKHYQDSNPVKLPQHFEQVDQVLVDILQQAIGQSNFTDSYLVFTENKAELDNLVNLLVLYSENSDKHDKYIANFNHLKSEYLLSLKPTILRLENFKQGNNFEKLTANANSSDLFNALNQRQGEDKFEQLQNAGELLLTSLENILYNKKLKVNDQLIEAFKLARDDFEIQILSFADIPTKLALKKWLKTAKQNDVFDPNLLAKFQFTRLTNINNLGLNLDVITKNLNQLSLINLKLRDYIITNALTAEKSWGIALILVVVNFISLCFAMLLFLCFFHNSIILCKVKLLVNLSELLKIKKINALLGFKV
ncbi:hypothetical protein [Catenovulum maritimum]|uniref:Uncharacterized protein n=1 Tax=Catenovulum maritimum TaxID=1513271 RepID=A0A0J8GRL9_9ALTE|nr:hypothetical protein [Catenovulum maritimum]KMT65357.1 hypothetical protein XM47_10050 [Catenovulum maritimum]